MPSENNDVVLPPDTLLRMALIKEEHLSNEYAYMRTIVRSHEKELAWLSLIVASLGVLNYYLIVKVYRVERANDAS